MREPKRSVVQEIVRFVIQRLTEKALADLWPTLEPEIRAKFKTLMDQHGITEEDIKTLLINRKLR